MTLHNKNPDKYPLQALAVSLSLNRFPRLCRDYPTRKDKPSLKASYYIPVMSIDPVKFAIWLVFVPL